MIARTSAWSNIFSHCGFQAAELIRFGGSQAHVFPGVTGHLGPGAPRLAVLILDNGRVLYGFSQYEFGALLIIAGLSPTDFSISGCTTSTKFLGSMQLADNEPFSQVARFDEYEGCRESVEDKERYINKVPVKKAKHGADSNSTTTHVPFNHRRAAEHLYANCFVAINSTGCAYRVTKHS